jgi:subtilisin family serine protease
MRKITDSGAQEGRQRRTMKRISISLLLILVTGTAMAAESARYIVGTRQAAKFSPLQIVRDPADAQAREVRSFESVNAFAANLTESEAAALRRSPYVRFVEPVVGVFATEVAATATPVVGGRRYSYAQTVPWGIETVHAPQVWPVTKGAGINLAILDTGIDSTHPDLQGHVKGGYNSFTSAESFHDDNKHGTHVAGTIIGNDNGFGVVGVAPDVNIWIAKVLDRTGNGSDETLVAGIDWLLKKKQEIGGNWIMSLSLGAADDSRIAREAFARAIANDVIVVAAAGNGGMPEVNYPAAYPSVVSVGAIDSLEAKARFSSYGTGLMIAGPGVGVLSTVPVGSFTVSDISLADGTIFDAAALVGSPKGELTGQYVFCGLGKPEDFPASVRGNIAVVRRGDIYFRDKGRNAQMAGASALVIVSDERSDWANWTLMPPFCDENNNCGPLKEDVEFPWLLTVGVSKASGDKLLASYQNALVSYRNEDYALLSGTSMATPHVAATVALLWSLAPTATPEQIRTALKLSARDLGAHGWDKDFGYGVVDALAGAKLISPSSFGLPPNPAPEPQPRRPSAGH